MTDLHTAARMALEALESMKHYAETVEPGLVVGIPAIAALRQALEQPQEGCAHCEHPMFVGRKCKHCGREHPQQDGGACPTCGAWHDEQIVKQLQLEPVATITREQIIAWAKEVWGDVSDKPWSEQTLNHLTAYATLIEQAVRQDEREQCAKLMQGMGRYSEADAIRARGTA